MQRDSPQRNRVTVALGSSLAPQGKKEKLHATNNYCILCSMMYGKQIRLSYLLNYRFASSPCTLFTSPSPPPLIIYYHVSDEASSRAVVFIKFAYIIQRRHGEPHAM